MLVFKISMWRLHSFIPCYISVTVSDMYCFVLFLPYIYVDINKYCTGPWVYEHKLNLRVSQKLHEYSWITYNTLVQSVSRWAVKHSLFQRSNSSQVSPVLSCKLLKCCFDSAKKIVQFKTNKIHICCTNLNELLGIVDCSY